MKTLEFFDRKLDDLVVAMKDVYALMGYGDHQPSEMVLGIIDDVMGDLRSHLELRYGYVLTDGFVGEKGCVTLQGVDFITGPVIASAMKNADKYALFVCTIGSGFDEYINKIKEEDDILRMFVADAVGSVLAECTVDLLISKLKSSANAQGWNISNNYSPGYCSWSLTDQRKLFSFFPEGITGISLNDSCLMHPVKSVSGIIAVGQNVVKKPYACAICNQESCIKNKKNRKI